jgi:glycosyltransferase involved in cell wall biosynthesis
MDIQVRQKLSVIIPVYNEETLLPKLLERVAKVLNEIEITSELIFVDNCSIDGTEELLKRAANADSRIKVIRFSRNFGPTVEASIAAGYSHASGDAAIVLYSDLQDPPELIPRFVELWKAGNDVVFGIQLKRKGEPLWRRMAVRVFYRAFQNFSESPSMENSGDFKLVSRKVIDVLNEMPERARFNRGLISWIGFQSIGLPYEREARSSGKSKANFFAITRTAFNGLTSFSLKPLRILTGTGFTITGLSIVFMLWLIVVALFGQPLPGLTTIACISVLTLGMTMGALGLIGEYVGRIQIEVKQRPLYVIDKTINLDR